MLASPAVKVLVLHGVDEHGPAGRGFVVKHRWEVVVAMARPGLEDVLEALLAQAELPEELKADEDYLHVLPLFDLSARAKEARRGAPLVRHGDRFRLLLAK